MTKLIYLLPIATMILVACCSITPLKEESKSYDSAWWHQQKINNLNYQYQIYGTFTYCASYQKKVYARFFWQQTGQDNYRLLLLNPLGNVELEMNIRSGKAQIINNTGQHYVTANAEEITSKFISIPIPFNNLPQWLIGLPGDAINYKLDKQYRLSELNYNYKGKVWKVLYSNYNTKNTPALPSNIELIEDGQHINLKIDNWIVK